MSTINHFTNIMITVNWIQSRNQIPSHTLVVIVNTILALKDQRKIEFLTICWLGL